MSSTCPTRPGVPITGLHPSGRHDDLAALAGEPLLPVGHVVVDDVDEVDLGALAGAALAGDAEQLVERDVEFVRLGERGARLGGDRRVVGAFQHLEPHRDAGQAGAQLMRRVGGEATLGVEHPLDPVGAEAERPRDVVDLTNARRWRAGHAEVAVAEARRTAGQSFERRRELAGLHGGEQRRRDDRHDGDDRRAAPPAPGTAR